MRRSWIAICGVLVVCGCDPGVAANFRLLPASAAQADSARSAQAARWAAAAAVERLALQFGLKPDARIEGECAQIWFLKPLILCTKLPADGTLTAGIFEFPSRRWSSKGDSLRLALADTLARFGRVQITQPA
ncbi:MAG: hypothetical protein NVS4B3_26010 [Gemmatimonadaceae bacterium]